jgi:hypothetical protein
VLESADRLAQVPGVVEPTQLQQRLLGRPHRRRTRFVDRGSQHLHVRQPDLPAQEGLTHLRQILQPLPDQHPPPRLPSTHAQVVPQPGRRGASADVLEGLGGLEHRGGLGEARSTWSPSRRSSRSRGSSCSGLSSARSSARTSATAAARRSNDASGEHMFEH